ncbi:hypothetical protein GCM10027203_63020 [Nonomuraea fastidiosa]
MVSGVAGADAHVRGAAAADPAPRDAPHPRMCAVCRVPLSGKTARTLAPRDTKSRAFAGGICDGPDAG